MTQLPRLLVLLALPMLSQHATCTHSDEDEDVFQHVNSPDIAIQQLKEKILMGLNRTEPPNISTRWMLKSNRHTPDKLSTAARKSNVSLTFSRVPVPQRPDIISFTLDSMLREHVRDVENAILVVHFSSLLPKRRKRQRRAHVRCTNDNKNLIKRDTAMLIKRLWGSRNMDDHRRLLSSILEESNVVPRDNKPGSGHMCSSYNTIERGEENPRRRRKSSVRKRQTEQFHVHMVVHVVKSTSGKKRKIASEEVTVQKAASVLVSIPKRFLVKAAASADRTLTVQVACRRCTRRVKMESVFVPCRGNYKEHISCKHLNSRRPYLVVTLANSTTITNSISES